MANSEHLAGWLSIADLGLRNTLINFLPKAHEKAVIAFLRVVEAAPFILAIDWHPVFNVSHLVSTRALRLSLAALLACVANAINAIEFGYQEGYRSNLWQAGGIPIAGVALPIATHWEVPIWALILITTGFPLVFTAFHGFVLFGFHKALAPPTSA